MGKTFRAPRSSQAEQWKVVEALFQAGFRFMSGRGSHAELPTRLRDVEQFIRENPDHPLKLTKANQALHRMAARHAARQFGGRGGAAIGELSVRRST
jgi:hypothetical protein